MGRVFYSIVVQCVCIVDTILCIDIHPQINGSIGHGVLVLSICTEGDFWCDVYSSITGRDECVSDYSG